MSGHELQIRVPYSAWGDGDEWQTGYEDVMSDLDEALELSGADGDDADHHGDHIIFFAIGPDVEELVRAVRPVLAAHGLLDVATGFLTDPDSDDFEVGTVVPLGE